jgi:hypothetical protein
MCFEMPFIQLSGLKQGNIITAIIAQKRQKWSKAA